MSISSAFPKPHLVSQREECKLQGAAGACRSSASPHSTASQKRKGDGRRFLREPVCGNCTGRCSAQISRSELLPVWGLDTEPGEDTFVLPAESASPASLLLRKAADSAVCLSPLLSPSPLSLALQHLPQFGLSHLHLAATQLQNVLPILCKPLLCAAALLPWGRPVSALRQEGLHLPPQPSRLAFCRHPLLVLSCSFW